MKNRKIGTSLGTVFAGAALVVGVAGCGHPSVSLKGPDRTQEARQIILKRVHTFQSETILANIQVTGSGVDRAASASVKAEGADDVRETVSTGSASLLSVNNGSTAWTYTIGGAHYGVAASLTPTGYDLRWAAGSLATLIQDVTFTKVRTLPDGRWQISFHGRLPGLGKVTGLMVYAPKAGVPRELELKQAGTTVNLSFPTYEVNLTLPTSTFQFTPPPGTTPVNADGPTVASLNQLATTLHFPLAVPLARSGLTLTGVNSTSSSKYGPEALLEFSGSAGPLLLTEYAGRYGLPLSGSSSSYPMNINGLLVTMSNLNSSSTMGMTQDGATAVIAEGGQAEVTSAVQNLTLPPKG